jgi:hypothetical protein
MPYKEWNIRRSCRANHLVDLIIDVPVFVGTLKNISRSPGNVIAWKAGEVELSPTKRLQPSLYGLVVLLLSWLVLGQKHTACRAWERI